MIERNLLRKVIKKIIPSTLKYKLFLAYLLLLLIPLSAINLYNFYTVENKMWLKSSEQSQNALDLIRQELEDYMGIAVKTKILLEQNLSIRDKLKNPEKYSYLDRRDEIEALFNGLTSSLFLSAPSVFYTINDLQGGNFLTYRPLNNNNQAQIMIDTFEEMQAQNEAYIWRRETSYVVRDYTISSELLSLYGVLKDEQMSPYGIVRISIDYKQWLSKMKKQSVNSEKYYILDINGEVVLASEDADSMDGKKIIEQIRKNNSPSINDGEFAYHYSYVPTLQWYIVRVIPIDILFAETNQLRYSFFWSFIVLTVLFTFVTFIISTNMSRPLRELQRKMRQLASSNLKTRIAEDRFDGEMLTVVQNFNSMADDFEHLIAKLKREERQKEAVRFQVLLSQMNPHFLLNTLNMIKSMSVITGEQHKVHEVSVALGRILETGLNVDVDMIFLEDEMKLINAFTFIYEQRFGQIIKISFEIEPDLQHTLVPKFSIQPLVENALIHAFKNIAEPTIIIRAEKQDNYLMLIVSDNGIGIDKAKEAKVLRGRKGIGLDNIQERLQLLFKEEAQFEMKSSENGTTVCLKVPFLQSEPYKQGG